jgi:tRNA nucleotidyltransferase/poly(A) polymerase
MTYAEFKQNFLPELLKIKSFKGKMDYANQHLQRIGSGTGRVVYDIDDEKILKLAKNPKGIAQNEAEAGAGYYRDTHHIVAIVFDSADTDEWLIAEKAKKVNEARIKELTGIPSLNDLWMYLKNFHSSSNGRGNIFGQDPEIIEELNNNEFVQDLQNFVADYSQQPGDYGRPSTYGEVLHDGQPSIVLTDYGLNDEVYDTHYKPKKERMYELYNFADGNDDILSDMPPQDAVDTRQSMWALMPYGVGDGPGVINEKFVSFVLGTDKYPTRRILPNMPSLVDEFHNVVNNLNEVLEKVGDKKKFYNNLLELQNYLIRRKFWDREPLNEETVEFDEANTPIVKPMSLDKNYSNGVAKTVAEKLNLGVPQYMGGGGFGYAYQINNNKVLKITTDICEVDAGAKIKRAKPKALVAIYNMYKIVDVKNSTSTYALIEEYIANKPIDEFFKYVSTLNEIQPEPNLYGNLLIALRKKKFDEYIELSQKILTDNPNINVTKADRQKAYNFIMGLFEIKKELMELQIKSDDYSNLENLGYKDGILTYFDIGGCFNIMQEPQFPPENRIDLPEDGSARFSTPDSIGRDNFPVFNTTDDSSPLQTNELPVNIFAEDLEYNHVVGDATQDKFQITERTKSYMPGSQAVEVKKKCRLAGLGNTSTACNQGDIGNLNFKSIDETTDVNIPAKLNGYDSIKIMGDDQQVGELGIMDRGIHGGNHYIAIDKIFIDKQFRGNNYANDAMKLLFQYADKNNLIITLTPDNMWGASVPKLKVWYKSLGFVENKGRKKDFQTMQLMYRLPKGSLNEVVKSTQKYYRAVEKNLGKTAEFEPEGFYEAIDDDGNPIFKYDTFWVSDKPEVAASKSVGGAVMGLYSMFLQHGKNPTVFYIYEIAEEPDVDISHWDTGDFYHLKEVRYRKPVKGRYVGKVTITDDFKKRLNAYYEISGSDEYGKPDEETREVFDDTNYDQYLAGVRDMVHEMRDQNLNEEIDASEAYHDEGVIRTMIQGRKDVGIITFKVYPQLLKMAIENDFGIIPVEQVDHKLDTSIVYRKTPRGEANAKKLHEIMKSHGGYVSDKTPEEAREIGKLLDYSDESINSFIQRIYGKKVPQEPAYDDYASMFINEQTIKDFESLIDKDNTTHNLDKFHLYDQDDFKVYAVNGEAVRDNGFDEWVDGGHHYVDADEKPEDQKYAKFIPEDEIWVDDVFIIKPNDLAAILLHERLERYLMKYYGLKYENAHTNFANPAEVIFRKKTKEGFDADVSDKIYNIFVRKFAKTHSMKKKLNESVIGEAQLMSLQDLPFIAEIEQLGGKIYSVGGAVRDEFLGKESKDLDVLITGVPMDQLEQILSKYGKVDAVGKSFGVLKFIPKGATEQIDVAIPRTEKPSGAGGHQGFDVSSDHALPIEKDLERRDFTINAVARDAEGNLVDPFGGTEDIKNKIIRMANPEAFSDDPLRMLRAVQFASRFGFTIEPKTMETIQNTAERIKEIPAERILTELDKILNKGDMRIGAQLLKDTGLFQQIFGFDLKQSTIDRTPFESIKTMGEFIYLLTRSLSNPSAYYKTNLRGDIDTFKEIKALEMAFGNADVSNPIMARSIASNMYLTSPKTLESQIIPKEIKTAAQELLSGKYPKSINELAVNGNDLMALGLQGKEIGDAQKMILLKIYSDQVRNNREELLSLVPAKNNVSENEYGSTYSTLRPQKIETWTVNGQQVKLDFFVEKYDIWNQYVVHDPSKESVLRFLEDEFPEFVEDENLKKELLWTLTDRELLDENGMKRVRYSAVVLDERSRQRLIERFRNEIPEDWEVIAHHMTINMGELSPEFIKFNGMSVRLSVNDIAKDDNVIAVGVSGFESKNVKPHITLAVNKQGGGKPKDSNNLTNWQKLKRPLLITGKVTEVT